MRLHLALALALAALTAPTTDAQSALLRRNGDLFAVPARNHSLEAVLQRLLDGPTAAQRVLGIHSAAPQGTRLLAVHEERGAITVTLSDDFTAALAPGGQREDAVEQIVKTALRATSAHAVHIVLRTPDGRLRGLDDPTPRDRPSAPPRRAADGPGGPGALAGRTIAFSPGHGWYWHATLGWLTQRPTLGGLTEDFHTNEIAMRYAMQALENLGARAFSCRERGEIRHEVIADDDSGAPTYSETGLWSQSASSGYSGGGYRFATTTLTSSATATWLMPVPADGIHPVYVFYRASGNRSPDARYLIVHSGGVTEVVVDQTGDDRRWIHLGDFSFAQAIGAAVVLDNRSDQPGKVVIADAVRVGAGTGSIARGGSSSGMPRWQECCRYWAEFAGAPSSVWDVPGFADNSDDVTARPKYAEWRGADAFVSLHTNAGGGTGTSSFIHDTAPTAGSAALQEAIHGRLIADIRARYSATWVDRGQKSANFGEVRELQTMPGVLLELAFHDTVGSVDHDALHDPRFREIAGLAIAHGVMSYFDPTASPPPDRPTALRITQDGGRGLLVAWDAAAAATGYSIEQSPDGVGFVETAQTSSTSWSTGPLAHGTALSFRVRAFNGSGRSFPTETLTAGTSHTRLADLLLVQGFDRLGEFVKHPENTANYLRLHADAIRRSGEFSLGFDAASNEAVTLGHVQLASYRAVDWAVGEESTADETFSATEQSLVTAYLAAGGRLLVTGAEIGWDLDLNGSAADRAFYRGVLGAQYVADDAGTYGFTPGAGIFAGLSAGTFDNGTGGTYHVDFPDVIAAADPSSAINMSYDLGGGAGLERITGNSRVVYLGFPLETITDADLRSAVMTRALRFLLGPRPLENAPTAPIGGNEPLWVELPTEAGAPYVLLSSLALGSSPLTTEHLLPLVPDGALLASLRPNSAIFVDFQGLLDGAGRATAGFAMPNIPSLAGLCFYFSGFTVTPAFGVQTMLPWTRACLQ